MKTQTLIGGLLVGGAACLPGAKRDSPTNPYPACPVASEFVINDFQYAYGPAPLDNYGTSLSLTFGDLTLNCPRTKSVSFGYNVLQCDDAGIISVVQEVGKGLIHVNYQAYCADATPASGATYGSLGFQTATVDISGSLTCTYPDAQNLAIKSCTQTTSDFVVAPATFFDGAAPSFTPIGTDGVAVASCPVVEGVNPILENAATCEHYA